MTTQVPQYLKKISTAEIGLKPRAIDSMVIDEANAEKLPIRVMRVYGTIRGTRKGVSQFGPFIQFNGEFESVNLMTGVRYRAKALLVPEIAEMSLADGIESAKRDNPEGFITFGLDIAADHNPSAKGGWAYKWVIIPLKQPEIVNNDDELRKLGESLGELPLLNGPQEESVEGEPPVSETTAKKKAKK